ncbi:hypothetical protein TH468_18175 [Thalassospira sp. MCCC 1A03138]|nr:hypothetical protein TH468_18175 [Thalassospira sp. MCCC 1A03138]
MGLKYLHFSLNSRNRYQDTCDWMLQPELVAITILEPPIYDFLLGHKVKKTIIFIILGMILGLLLGSSIGIVGFGIAVNGAIPCALIGALIGGLAAPKLSK